MLQFRSFDLESVNAQRRSEGRGKTKTEAAVQTELQICI